jgi:hypothetical protein
MTLLYISERRDARNFCFPMPLHTLYSWTWNGKGEQGDTMRNSVTKRNIQSKAKGVSTR